MNRLLVSSVRAVVRAACLLCFLWTVGEAHAQPPGRQPQPNIVFMLADDQGWNGLSVAMAPDVPGSRGEIFQTPNLARLAAQGMRFSNAYAPAPVCSPTRISIQTGKSPAQLHWTKAAPPERGHRLLEPRLIKDIADSQTTVGELLQKAGYATAHYGKWHIGGGGPGEHGYDEHDGDTGNEQALQFTDPNPVDIFGMAARAEAFMQKNAKSGKPFFIQLSWNALHAPENALHATMAKYEKLTSGGNDRGKRAATAAITEDLDTGVGRVMAALDRLGLTKNTYVIYMSDNGAGGGGGKRGGLSGGKGSVWEGGIRVPLIIRGPGIAADSWCHQPVVGYDLLPTLCEWAGVPATAVPEGVEGGSITSLLSHEGDGGVRRPREELVFHFPHYQSNDGPHSAIRIGPLKLIRFYEDDRVVLFDLSKDIGERTDLAQRLPAEAKRMRERLEKYLAAVAAQMPTPNPDFDPATPRQTREKGTNKEMKRKKKA
jgi:arylsulfatase A-like enzyme